MKQTPVTNSVEVAERGKFRCEDCGNVYTKGWSDEEAAAESQAAFGISSGAVVCDDCYNKIMYTRSQRVETRSATEPTLPETPKGD